MSTPLVDTNGAWDSVREETTMTVARIAQRLKMGTPGYVNNRLYRWRKGTLPL